MTTATATIAAVRTFSVDKAHSEATFQVRHLLTKVRGHFSDFEGEIRYDEAHPEQSSVKLTIQAASIDTAEPSRDAHLRSADFFAVEEFPAISFTSTKVAARTGNELEVTGDLTIHGVTRTITVPVTFLGAAKDPWGNTRIAFEGEYTISRKDFGLNWNAALETGGVLVGDDVKIGVSIQAIAQ
jgi:polyisoprenoid-binding protein YceI